MANISISDLRPTGSEFFADSESFMSELTDKNLTKFTGGLDSFFCGLHALSIVNIPNPFPGGFSAPVW